MQLATKIIIIISITVTTIISLMFFVLGTHFNNQIENHLLTTARVIYKNIVLVRQWVAQREGVFQLKHPGDKKNPFLLHPEVTTTRGDTLIMRNPALVTRELSELSYKEGKDFSFHLSSLRYINPVNKPDDFEENALLFFERQKSPQKNIEFFRSETIDGKEYFRYFAPLVTKKSCLKCHEQQGYDTGDIRGGISIMLETDQHFKAKQQHLMFFILTGVISIFALSIPIYYAIKRSIITPLKTIEQATDKMRLGNYNFQLKINSADEIGRLSSAFDLMRKRIKESTHRIISSEKKYRKLSDYSFDAMAIISTDGTIIDCNAKLVHLSGFEASELKKKNFDELVDMNQKTSLKPGKTKPGTTEHFEAIFISKDKIKIPVEVYIIKDFRLDEYGNVSFVYIRDLSERKKIEQYSLQTEKMFTLGQISAGIAHEIRNPVFALNNNLDYLKDNCPNNIHFKEIYPDFKQSINRIQKLVSSILDYAKPHELSFKQIDIEDIIQKALTLVKKQFEKSFFTIESDFKHNGLLIEADEHKIEQVFVNLFLNAFQALEGTGHLKVSTQISGKHLQVNIEDSGKGIASKDLKRIFDPFYTTSSSGTGLGMAIVQRILEQHNTHYWIKSEEGLGTNFYILFHIYEVKN